MLNKHHSASTPMSLFTVQYTPKSTSEILGQDAAIEKVRKFIANFKTAKKRALLLYGPAGSGKTSTAYAIAKEHNFEILEVNASDFRNEEQLSKTIGSASRQQSLFNRPKLLLVDEVDGLSGTKDRGAIPALKNLIKETSFPMFITANNPWDSKFSPLRSACEMVEFKEPTHAIVLEILKNVCAKEHINYEEKALASLARRAGGDIRGALIDIQTLAINNQFTSAQLELLSDREKTDTVFNALMKIFKTTDANVARTAFDHLEEDLEEIQNWIDENMSKEYTKPMDIYRAYEKVSKADVFRGRIMNRQHWHFLAVISVLLSAGVALSKDEKYKQFILYSQPQRFLKMWRAKQKYAQRTAIAEKISKKTHCSTKVAREKTLPYVQSMMKNKVMAEQLTNYFELNDDELAWLNGR